MFEFDTQRIVMALITSPWFYAVLLGCCGIASVFDQYLSDDKSTESILALKNKRAGAKIDLFEPPVSTHGDSLGTQELVDIDELASIREDLSNQVKTVSGPAQSNSLKESLNQPSLPVTAAKDSIVFRELIRKSELTDKETLGASGSLPTHTPPQESVPSTAVMPKMDEFSMACMQSYVDRMDQMEDITYYQGDGNSA